MLQYHDVGLRSWPDAMCSGCTECTKMGLLDIVLQHWLEVVKCCLLGHGNVAVEAACLMGVLT